MRKDSITSPLDGARNRLSPHRWTMLSAAKAREKIRGGRATYRRASPTGEARRLLLRQDDPGVDGHAAIVERQAGVQVHLVDLRLFLQQAAERNECFGNGVDV